MSWLAQWNQQHDQKSYCLGCEEGRVQGSYWPTSKGRSPVFQGYGMHISGSMFRVAGAFSTQSRQGTDTGAALYLHSVGCPPLYSQ